MRALITCLIFNLIYLKNLLASPPSWPGGDAVVSVDSKDEFGGNMSGLEFVPHSGGNSTMWMIQNEPSTLFNLEFNGKQWVSISGKYLNL